MRPPSRLCPSRTSLCGRIAPRTPHQRRTGTPARALGRRGCPGSRARARARQQAPRGPRRRRVGRSPPPTSARLACFGTETDALLGGHTSKLYLTNRRLIANNTVGLWTVELATDIASCAIVENGIPFFKSTVVRVDLKRRSSIATARACYEASASTSQSVTAIASLRLWKALCGNALAYA